MAIVEYGTTDSFVINYDDSFTEAPRRAAALAATVERDLAVMRDWFGIADGFGPSDRCTINIGQVDGAAADNFGYASGGNTVVNVNPATGWPSDAHTQQLCDDAVRGLFVMEFVEVMMSLDNQRRGTTRWVPNGSNGEGLSLVSAQVLYPAAMYGLGSLGFPRAWQWYAASPDTSGRRPNWVDTTEASDGDPISWGCSEVFIFFLVTQLGHPLRDVIQQAGATLEDTYHNLTGTTGGFDAMSAVLDPFFPPGGGMQPGTDDPFPLYPDASQRSVALTVTVQELSRILHPEQEAQRQLPFPCTGTVADRFVPCDVALRVSVHATPVGFGSPHVQWTIRPDAIVGPGGVSVDAQILPADPLNPSAPMQSQTVSVTVQTVTTDPVSPGGQVGPSRLVVDLPSVGGELNIVIDCQVTDAAVTAPGTVTATLDRAYATRQVIWLGDSTDQIRQCTAQAGKLTGYLFRPILGQIMPDPPPDFVRAMTQLRQLLDQLHELRLKQDGKGVEALTGVMRDYLNIPDTLLAAPVTE